MNPGDVGPFYYHPFPDFFPAQSLHHGLEQPQHRWHSFMVPVEWQAHRTSKNTLGKMTVKCINMLNHSYIKYKKQSVWSLKQSLCALWKGTQRGSFPNRLRIWKQIHLISITMLNLQAGQSALKSHEVIDSAYSDLLQWSLLYLKLHSFTAAFKLKGITTKQNSARLWTEQINHVPWMHNDTLQIFNWIIYNYLHSQQCYELAHK